MNPYVETFKDESFNSINCQLDDIEKKYQITVLYACETGSRGVGVDVEESDFDVKGFYVASEDEYLRVIRSVKLVLKLDHINLHVGKYEFDLDIELRDIKHYFFQKIELNELRSDFWFKSTIVYRNHFTDDIISTLNQHLNPPVFIFSPNDKSGMVTLMKNLKHSGNVINKKLLSLLISCIHQLHTEIFTDELSKFPLYNIYDEIEFLKSHLQEVKECLNSEEVELLMKNLEQVEVLHNRKKVGRMSVIKKIPEVIISFHKMIQDKYHPEQKRKMLSQIKGKLELNWAQSVFEYYLFKDTQLNIK